MKFEQLKKNLELLGKEVVAEVVSQLLAADKSDTGSLIASLNQQVLETSNGLMLNILGNDYFRIIDEGRRPGSKMPPVKAIVPWVERKGIIYKNNKGGMISKESTAFLVARSIGIKGIKPLHIKQKVVQNLLNNKLEFIKKGINIDIAKYINEQIFDKK